MTSGIISPNLKVASRKDVPKFEGERRQVNSWSGDVSNFCRKTPCRLSKLLSPVNEDILGDRSRLDVFLEQRDGSLVQGDTLGKNQKIIHRFYVA